MTNVWVRLLPQMYVSGTRGKNWITHDILYESDSHAWVCTALEYLLHPHFWCKIMFAFSGWPVVIVVFTNSTLCVIYVNNSQNYVFWNFLHTSKNFEGRGQLESPYPDPCSPVDPPLSNCKVLDRSALCFSHAVARGTGVVIGYLSALAQQNYWLIGGYESARMFGLAAAVD